MPESSNHRWGDYYLSGGRKGKKSWALELVHTVNQMIPTFNELFDERQAAERLLKHEDVIVQAPTGSGKTLAYVLPLFTILQRKESWSANEVGALVIVPSRELAKQVGFVCKPFADALSLKMHVMVGGKKGKRDAEMTNILNASLIIATPGRLQSVISSSVNFKKSLKTLEILVVDEADRYTDAGFKASMTEILESLPKQRRTGLFSATQAKEMEEIVKFGLRNPIQITLENSGKVVDSVETISPATLKNFYMTVRADEKLYALVDFIGNHPKSKILIFFSTCHCVEYMHALLMHLISKRQIFALHGRKKKKGDHQLERFRTTGRSLMLCTDVLSRGIDVDNIDWVVQFDVPKQTSWFVHRGGRSARCGKEGNNLLLLTHEETAYIEFIQNYEKVSLTEMKADLKDEGGAERIRQRIVELASKERELLESGTRAFVSFIESYMRHDCNVVCSSKDLDVVGYGHAYGLLRLPRMKELQNKDLGGFKRSDINTAEIPYKNAEKERRRQQKLLLRTEEVRPLKKGARMLPKRGLFKVRKESTRSSRIRPRKRPYSGGKEQVEHMESDFTLFKKLKKGRLAKKELELLEEGS